MKLSLQPHPANPPRGVTGVTCTVVREAATLHLVYAITGDPDAVRLPPATLPARTDGLWQTTCLELFVAEAGTAYREFNFAPSGQWAAYGFTGRREGMAPLTMGTPPAIGITMEAEAILVAVDLAEIGADTLRLGITVVIEEADGTKSYWALRHGGDAPDFHDPDCFVAQLPPAD
ncbi:DOMON-like domain-containing protein [uncultured Sphingomonas sp.]|uniref:DOMON-like domain-containing protein n=1 Tax=uncultured Sphingomonas sp. TaxID=158754 RepID=UPI0025F66264|nr:DOMON-like domain-containing protein [uncultured Sphingomonas sp.]